MWRLSHIFDPIGLTLRPKKVFYYRNCFASLQHASVVAVWGITCRERSLR
ncbi:hypothetical protein V1291_004379 [Nitrobacteraceae bacterium AZCC 1564]